MVAVAAAPQVDGAPPSRKSGDPQALFMRITSLSADEIGLPSLSDDESDAQAEPEGGTGSDQLGRSLPLRRQQSGFEHMVGLLRTSAGGRGGSWQKMLARSSLPRAGSCGSGILPAADSLLPSMGCMRDRGVSSHGGTSSSSGTEGLSAAQIMMRSMEAEMRRRKARYLLHQGSGVGKPPQQQQQQPQRMGAGAPQPLTLAQPDLPMTQAPQLRSAGGAGGGGGVHDYTRALPASTGLECWQVKQLLSNLPLVLAQQARTDTTRHDRQPGTRALPASTGQLDLPPQLAQQLAQQARTSDSRHSRQRCARVLSAFRVWTAPATAAPRAPSTGESDPWLDLPPGMLVWK
jgi:hypothetical protein